MLLLGTISAHDYILVLR